MKAPLSLNLVAKEPSQARDPVCGMSVDPQSAAALDRFCLCLGSFAGNVSLAHGANTLVLAGGLGLRLRDHLRTSGFAEALVAKAEYRSILEQLPVKLITHPEPGLYGAVAAFAARLAGSP